MKKFSLFLNCLISIKFSLPELTCGTVFAPGSGSKTDLKNSCLVKSKFCPNYYWKHVFFLEILVLRLTIKEEYYTWKYRE